MIILTIKINSANTFDQNQFTNFNYFIIKKPETYFKVM